MVVGRPRRVPLLAAVAAVTLLLSMGPRLVLGHAELATASPADKSTVQGSPPELVFTFTEPVNPSKSSLKLVDASGTIVADGSSVDPSDAKKMHLTVPPQPPGVYTVRWTTASALDGDIAHGTTTFTIAPATPSPSVASSATPTPSVVASAPAGTSPSIASSPSPSGGSGAPASTSDALIPVIAAIVILGAFGLWLLRSRSRRVG